MKTSNKILLGTFIFILLVTLGTMIYAKNNMIITEHEDKVGSGNIIEQELAAEYVATELRLDGSYKYTLDPNATNILIRTDKNLVNHFRMSDSDRLSFYREGTLHIQPSEKIEFIIGVASKPELSITAKDRAVVSNRGELNQELNIKAVDRSNVNLNIDSESLTARLKDKGKVNVTGNCKNLIADTEDVSALVMANVSLDDILLKMEDSSHFKVQTSQNANIQMEDLSSASFQTKWDTGLNKIRDKATITIGGSEVISADNPNN